jgi:hypothetical protein
MLAWGMRNYVTIAMLVTMALWGINFEPGATFSGLYLLRTLIVQIFVIPDIINGFVQSTVSLNRISGFLTTKDFAEYI